jgi:hypothetical protein
MRAEVIPCRDDAECQALGAFLADRIYEFNAKATGYKVGMAADCDAFQITEIVSALQRMVGNGRRAASIA